METIIKTIAKAIVILAIAIFIAWWLKIALERNEAFYCEKLVDQSKQFDLWYATENEREGCKSVGVILPPDNK